MRASPGFAMLVLAAVSGCGGDSVLTPPPPPPPGVASLLVDGGNHQAAEAGSAVSTPPTALVKDQSGNPMAQVSVTFAIEQGNGTLTGATTTTGSDGRARVGSWTLGLGANRLRATAGNLGPIFWDATGLEPALATGTVPASGGVVAINKPGHPLNGLEVKVPPNAFSGLTEFTLRAGSTTGLPARPGLSFASPPVALSSSAFGYTSGDPLEIRVPVTLAAGAVPVGILFDPASGALEVVPAVPTGPGVVAVFTRHLNPANFWTGSVSASAGLASHAHSTANPIVQLVIGQVQYSSLAGDISSSYNPAVDNWEFPYTPLGGDLGTSMRAGYALTALSWFRTRRTSGPLAHRFENAPGVYESNDRGIKMAAVAAGKYDIPAVVAYWQAMKTAGAAAGVTVDSLQFVAIKAAIYLTGQPQLLLALSTSQPLFPGITYIVHRVTANGLQVTVGTTDPNQIRLSDVQLVAGSFQPQSFGYVDPDTGQPIGAILSLDSWKFAGASAGAPFTAIDELWPYVLDRTIGQREGWPTSRFEVNGDARIKGDTVIHWSPNHRIWAVCDSCAIGYPPTANIDPTGPVAGWRWWENTSGSWALNSGFLPYRLAMGNGMAHGETAPGVRSGGVQLVIPPVGSGYSRYLDWKPLVIKTVTLEVRPVPAAPAPFAVLEGVNFTLSATYSDPVPPSPRFEWDMGDGRKLNTATPLLTATYPAPAANGSQQSYTVKVSLYEGNTLLAAGTLSVTVKAALPIWRLDSAGVTLSGTVQNPAEVDTAYYNHVVRAMSALAASPGDNHVIAAGGKALLQQVLAGQGGEVTGIVTPPNAIHFGLAEPPNFTMGPIGNGVFHGEFCIGDDPLTPGCEYFTNTITATMTPGVLRGTFTLMAWPTGPVVYTVGFRAVQVMP